MPAASLWRAAGISKDSRSAESVETLSNRAVDGEAGTPKWFSTRPSDQTVLHEGENLKLFAHLTTEAIRDCVFCPFKQLGIPRRAVIQRDCRDPAKDIVRAVTISQIRRQTLPLGVIAP